MNQQYVRLFMIILAILLLAAGCKPDLIISEFTVGTVRTEHDATTGKNYWIADATVKVQNNDTDDCNSSFKVRASAGWKGDPDHGMYGWQFTTSSFTKKTSWDCGPLDANEETTYTGTMYIWECTPGNIGATIDLWVTVDPAPGTISEDDETNNASVVISKVMPSCP